MNAEKLHILASAIYEDLEETQVQPIFQNLVNALQNQVNQPQQPTHQQQISEHLTKLYDTLSQSSSNTFSPAWTQLLQELSIDHLLGNKLSDKLKGTFERNQITPSVALDEIKTLNAHLTTLTTHIDNLIDSFEFLGIGKEDLEPGECEVGFLIPRYAVEDKLNNFSKELNDINGILRLFAEITTGKRQDFDIRSISSTDLGVTVTVAITLAAALAYTVNLIINSYKQILEIKKLRAEMHNQGVPFDKLKGISGFANSKMKKVIDEISKELFKKYYKNNDEPRYHELVTELRFALNKIARRIDRGFNIEIRVEPPVQKKGEKTTAGYQQEVKYTEYIKSTYENRQFIKTNIEPILSLRESGIKKPKIPKFKKKK